MSSTALPQLRSEIEHAHATIARCEEALLMAEIWSECSVIHTLERILEQCRAALDMLREAQTRLALGNVVPE